MRKLILIALAACALAVLAATAMAATKSVKVGDNYYVRSQRRPEGDRLQGHDGAGGASPAANPHRSPSPRPAPSSTPACAPGTYRKKMRKRGTYTIYCTIHGTRDQKMKLVVK